MWLATIPTIIGIILSVPALAGIAYGGFQFHQEVAANTNWRLIQTFERLDLIRSQRRLTQVEWVTWCKAGKELEIFNQCPPR